MGSANTQDVIDGFALELLRTGDMLAGLAVDLVETLPAEAYPGEKPAAVVMEMITGSIRTALVDADQSDVQLPSSSCGRRPIGSSSTFASRSP